MKNVANFYGHLEYFSVIWYNLWPFGVVCGPLVNFSRFGMFGPRKIWQPWSSSSSPEEEEKKIFCCPCVAVNKIAIFITKTISSKGF
jgi:hypothetical protein